MKIGILEEQKAPLDKRVALTPKQCRNILDKYPFIDIAVKSSKHRCYSDNMYKKEDIQVVESLLDCDVLLGIKEVPIDSLIEEKTYLFFSHTIKCQIYNRGLLSSLIEKNIRMIDYEVLKDDLQRRLIGFGKYAGIVGAYNGFLSYGLKRNRYKLRRAHESTDRSHMEEEFKNITLQHEKIIITGNGRVGKGILEVINSIGIKEVSKESFLNSNYNYPVFTHLSAMDYNKRIDHSQGSKQDFYQNPHLYKSCFMKFASVGDIFIAGHYYGEGSPFLFTREDAKNKDFNLSVVADVSCDIDGPVACTIRPSTIEDPIYGYNPKTEKEDDFRRDGVIAVMAVDNLPCELPRDASSDFGTELIQKIIPLLIQKNHPIISNATICQDGKLNSRFEYLTGFLAQC